MLLGGQVNECQCSCGCEISYETEVMICSDCHCGDHQNQYGVVLCGDCLYPIQECEHGRESKNG